MAIGLSWWLACAKDAGSVADVTPVGDGLFIQGCPAPGEALARVIGVQDKLPGVAAVGTRGDLLLANEVSAWVITRPDAQSTYYHYGGIVADAAPVLACEVVGDDVLDEIGLVLGELDLIDFPSSVLHAFRADSVMVLADGSDGEAAVVRAIGTDDMYWLVEYELIREKVGDGGRPVSSPWGLELTVDYTLQPNSPVLEVDWSLANPAYGDARSLITGALLSYAPGMRSYAAGTGSVSFGGLSLASGIPYRVAADGQRAFAYGVEGGTLAATSVSGIEVSIDLDQALLSPIDLPPGGSGSSHALASVGGVGGGASATVPLVERSPVRLPDSTAAARTVSGVVRDGLGLPITDAVVVAWGDGGDGPEPFDAAWTDADGAYLLGLPDFAPSPWTWTVVAEAPGRDPVGPVEPGDVTMGGAGSVEVVVTEQGLAAPARLHWQRTDGVVQHDWVIRDAVVSLAPGTWTWTATRGFAYEPVTGTVEVRVGRTSAVAVALERVVDTAGWRSLDTHVHDSWSPDGSVTPEDQVRHAAAHGLELVLHTNHEIIVDETHLPVDADVNLWVQSFVGEEVTASVPEHMTMLTVVPDGSVRGGPVRWYGLDLPSLFAAMLDRSEGGLRIFNHPGYMDLVGWDPVTATPAVTDPVLLGLPAGSAVWSFDFEGIEVMNGMSSPFAQGNGRFEKWQSLLNAGHRVFPVGCSDDHGGDEVGFPVSFVALDTDAPFTVRDDDLLDALRLGHVTASAGAFLRVSVGDAMPGDLVGASGAVTVAIEVAAPRAIDVTHVVVFRDCDEVAQLATDAPDGIVKLETTVDVVVDQDASITVAAFGAGLLPPGMPQFDAAGVPRALANAIFVDVDGNGVFDAPGGRVCSYDLTP